MSTEPWAIQSISTAQLKDHLEPDEAATLVMEVAARYFGRSPARSMQTTSLVKDFPGLFSDSIEERVSAFNLLSRELLDRSVQSSQDAPESLLSATVAAAAFLVGRGTSHLFLLQRLQRHAPSAAAWFGAIAALTGPRSWDRYWLRAVKGAERLLRPEFEWTEPAAADIGWTEISWLAKNFDGLDVLVDLPKMLPRTLSIEVVVGATCQLRIAGETVDSSDFRHEATPAVPTPSTDRERSLEDALSQFLTLAKRAGHLLDTVSTPKQKSLPLERTASSEKPPKVRKSRRYPRSS